MKITKIILFTFLCAMTIFNSEAKKIQDNRSPELKKVIGFLKKIPQKGYLFGHHDDTLYGIGWEGDEGRSDVKSVCGDYPSIISFDLGHIELGNEKSLDNVAFSKIHREILNQNKRGGIVTLSWHLDNPLTGKDAWDVSSNKVVSSILPDGENHSKFKLWIERLCDFINSLKDENGKKIAVIFRPWHEHTGSWFWWGKKLCTADEYKALWRMTYEMMQERGVDNVAFAYSPGSEYNNTYEYFERYPGDDIIDILGVDTYQFDKEVYKKELDKALNILKQAGEEHKKPIALTETGFEAIPDSTWWTEVLMPIINKYPISYMVVWRNAREKVNHYYAPYPGQKSADNFISFYNDKKTLFLNDINKKIHK